MPIHDWTRAEAGTFHNFHLLWTATITNRLNKGVLPPGFFAMAEQIVGRPQPDVVALRRETRPERPEAGGGIAIEEAPPRTQFVLSAEVERYAKKVNRVAIRHSSGDVVAVIEIVSPGNKDSAHAIRAFKQKAVDLLHQGINLLLIDLFPPTTRDPNGIHPLIWDEITDQHFELPAGKQLTFASYMAEPTKTAYVQPAAVGDLLPEMPLFLNPGRYVTVSLEGMYQATWDELPPELRETIDPQEPNR